MNDLEDDVRDGRDELADNLKMIGHYGGGDPLAEKKWIFSNKKVFKLKLFQIGIARIWPLPCYPIMTGATTYVFCISLSLRATPPLTSLNSIYASTKEGSKKLIQLSSIISAVVFPGISVEEFRNTLIAIK
ncbi:hypothetical protein Tco_0865028, partial [Tanacetum coccineum]